MSDKRQYLRTEMNLKIKIWGEETPETLLNTRDLSDGGVFLLAEDQSLLPIGTIVSVQVQGLPFEAPIKTMQVVRLEHAGFGLKHLD